MRLIRFGEPGHERPGVLSPDDQRMDLSGFGEDWNEEFFGTGGLARLEGWLGEHANRCPIVDDDIRLGACIARPSKSSMFEITTASISDGCTLASRSAARHASRTSSG